MSFGDFCELGHIRFQIYKLEELVKIVDVEIDDSQ